MQNEVSSAAGESGDLGTLTGKFMEMQVAAKRDWNSSVRWDPRALRDLADAKVESPRSCVPSSVAEFETVKSVAAKESQ